MTRHGRPAYAYEHENLLFEIYKDVFHISVYNAAQDFGKLDEEEISYTFEVTLVETSKIIYRHSDLIESNVNKDFQPYTTASEAMLAAWIVCESLYIQCNAGMARFPTITLM